MEECFTRYASEDVSSQVCMGSRIETHFLKSVCDYQAGLRVIDILLVMSVSYVRVFDKHTHELHY